MSELLLPFAHDENGNLIHIDDAEKDVKYFCPNPNCGCELSLRISKIPYGQKYHKRNHFAHKNYPENNCSESFLHHYFKEKCAKYIQMKIDSKSEIPFRWRCKKCYDEHTGNLLRKALKVKTEYNFGDCKSDIALLDVDDKVIIVIEIVVTHKPENKTLQYYRKNNIACLQIKVEDFSDCDKISEKLSHPDDVLVSKCRYHKCRCGNYKRRAYLQIKLIRCPYCDELTKIAKKYIGNDEVEPEYFNKEEIEKAEKEGVKFIERNISIVNKHEIVNSCPHCNNTTFKTHSNFLKNRHIPSVKELELGDQCYSCEMKKIILSKLRSQDGKRKCPECQGSLRLRKGPTGLFWACNKYPNCRHTESIPELLEWDI